MITQISSGNTPIYIYRNLIEVDYSATTEFQLTFTKDDKSINPISYPFSLVENPEYLNSNFFYIELPEDLLVQLGVYTLKLVKYNDILGDYTDLIYSEKVKVINVDTKRIQFKAKTT